MHDAIRRTVIEQLEWRMLFTAISSGQTIEGNIVATGQQDTYSFTASAGNSVTLSVGDTDSASAYEPSFTIFDSSGNKVTGGEEPFTDDSVTRGFQVPSTGGGTYTAVVQNEVLRLPERTMSSWPLRPRPRQQTAMVMVEQSSVARPKPGQSIARVI